MSTYDAAWLNRCLRCSVVIKVGMLGDSQIGKTSLMVKYVEGHFDEDYIQTLGAPSSFTYTRRLLIHFNPSTSAHVQYDLHNICSISPLHPQNPPLFTLCTSSHLRCHPTTIAILTTIPNDNLPSCWSAHDTQASTSWRRPSQCAGHPSRSRCGI